MVAQDMENDEDDDWGGFLGIVAGVGLGLLGAAIIDALTKPKCPNCGFAVERNSSYCNNCQTILRWQ